MQSTHSTVAGCQKRQMSITRSKDVQDNVCQKLRRSVQAALSYWR